MSGDIIKVVAQRPITRDAIEVYVLRYRKSVVGYVRGGEVTEWTNEFLVLENGEPTWRAYPPGGEAQPFASISGLVDHRLSQYYPFLAELKTWVKEHSETLSVS